MIKVIHSVSGPTTSDVYTGTDARYIVIQMTAASGDDRTRVKAVAKLEGSMDNENWIRIATLTAEGDGSAQDGGPIETFWPLYRVRVIEVVDCVVDVFLAKGR